MSNCMEENIDNLHTEFQLFCVWLLYIVKIGTNQSEARYIYHKKHLW